MTTVAATPVAPAKQAKELPKKLSPEESSWRYQFIGKCVDRGINLPANNRFAVQGSMSVQDLCTANVKTLQDIAIKVKKANDEHDPEFNGTEALKINSIPAEDWLNFLRYTIRKKNHDAYVALRRDEIKELKDTIDRAKTPEEQRREAELKLQALTTELGVEAE